MICKNCGAKISDAASFCPMCGEAARTSGRKPTAQKLMNEGQYVSPNIVLCPDGKYRWIYEYSLLKNPSIFLLIWRIFFFIILGIFAFVFLIDTVNGYMDGERIIETLRFLGFFLIGMTAVVGLSYLIYAAVMGGKYCVMFEMDDRGISHKQMPHQVKKAQAIASLARYAGAASGSFSAMGAGIAASRTEMYSQFDKVRSVRVHRRSHTIKVNELLEKNQVYAADEDFDFVLNYILQRVPENAIKL